VILAFAASFRAFESFFCRTTTAPAASQYSLSMFNSISTDLHDLCISVLSTNVGAVEGEVIIEIGLVVLKLGVRRGLSCTDHSACVSLVQ